MKIVLPYPDKQLNPNARLHFHDLRKIKKAVRADTAWDVMGQIPVRARQKLAQREEPMGLHITFIPPDKHARDLDNAIAAFKAQQDGIADALGVNDKLFRPEYVLADPEAPGRVEVTVLP